MREQLTIDPTNPETWPVIMTIRDIQAISPMGRIKLLEMAQTGELPARRVRGRWMITRDVFIEWLKRT